MFRSHSENSAGMRHPHYMIWFVNDCSGRPMPLTRSFTTTGVSRTWPGYHWCTCLDVASGGAGTLVWASHYCQLAQRLCGQIHATTDAVWIGFPQVFRYRLNDWQVDRDLHIALQAMLGFYLIPEFRVYILWSGQGILGRTTLVEC